MALQDATHRLRVEERLNIGRRLLHADAPTAGTLTVAATESSGELVAAFLSTWAPGSRDFLSSVLQDAQVDAFQDQQRDFGERTVRVQTLAANDGALVTTTIYE